MDRREIIEIVNEIARPLGYMGKAGRYWKRDLELTKLLELQGSRWGKGLYITVGVMLNDRVVTGGAPGPGEWDIAKRADRLESPFQAMFVACAGDDNDDMESEEMRDALRWLLEWMESGTLEPARIREALRTSTSWVRSGALVRVDIKRWAERN